MDAVLAADNHANFAQLFQLCPIISLASFSLCSVSMKKHSADEATKLTVERPMTEPRGRMLFRMAMHVVHRDKSCRNRISTRPGG